ncbi:MAG: peptidoglycan-binding domain-containing protein [Acidobacteriota bacterium]
MIRTILLLAAALFVFAGFTNAQGTAATTPTTSTTTEKPKRAPIFRPNKDQIKQVQTILKDKKLYTGEASGTYNDETRTGIKSFQKDNGLRETGTLNRATLEKFGVELTDKQKEIPVTESSLTPESGTSKKPKTTPAATSASDKSPTAEKPKRAPVFRASKDQISAAQKLLRSKSMYAGDETGKLDDATREGLKKFQDANGVKVTGTLNAATLEKMGIELTDKQKADAAEAAKSSN